MCLCILSLLLLLPTILRAQANASPENRFLIIVETSRAMEKRKTGIAVVLDHLLGSGIQGQMRAGDTLGVWTFNDELHAGEFPLQTWSPASQKRIATSVVDFLAAQKFAKQPRFEVVSSSLDTLIKSSPFITVFIISSGTEDIKGTAFADEINQSLRSWRDEQQKARMPLVIVLRADQGVVRKFSVTPAPWQVEMPPLPTALTATKPPPQKPSTVRTSSVPPLIVSGTRTQSTVPPLIITGSRSSSQPTSTNTAPQAAANQASQSGDSVARATNATVSNSPPVSQPVIDPAANQSGTGANPSDSRAAIAPSKTELTQTNAAAAVEPSGTPKSSVESSAPAETPSLATADRGSVVIVKRVILFGVIALALVIAVVLLRRSRASHVSLITHSIDRERE